MAKTKMKSIVGNFLDEINGGKTEFARAYRMAVLVNRNLKWDLTGKLKTECIKVNEDRTATIPDHSLKVKKVSIRDESTGKLVGLTKNNNLSFSTKELSEELDFERENVYHLGDDDEVFNTYITESLGKGGYRNIGEYRISEKEGIVVLSPDFCYSEIVLEFTSSADEEGDVCVNELVADALLAGIRFRWHVAKKGVTAFDKQFYKAEWIKEKRNARYRLKKPNIQDMNRIARQSTKFLKS